MPIFDVAEAREFDKAQLQSATLYPDAAIEAAEVAIRARFELHIGVALSATTSTEYYNGSGKNTLRLDHRNPRAESTPRPVTLTSVTVVAVDGTETNFTVAELADVVRYRDKIVRQSGVFPVGHRNIKVVYEHGYVTVPYEIKQAALLVATLPPPDGLVPSPTSSYSTEGTENGIDWSRKKDPARGRWYGNENVDGPLREHREIERVLVVL